MFKLYTGRNHCVDDKRQCNQIAPMQLTLEVNEEAAMRQTRHAGAEAYQCWVWLDVELFLAKRAAVTEVSLVGASDLHVIVTTATLLDIKLKVDQGQSDSLTLL